MRSRNVRRGGSEGSAARAHPTVPYATHQDVRVVLNPASGGGNDAADVSEHVREVMGASLLVTEAAGEARRHAAEAVREGAALVVAAGGDGTVQEVVAGLVEASRSAEDAPLLGVLPLGTGNDLARALGTPRKWRDAADLLATGARVRTLDLLDVSVDGQRTLAANSVIVGNGARPGRMLDEEAKARWGPLSYLRAAVDVALELEPLELELALDAAKPRTLEVLNVIVANGRSAGGGIPIATGGSPFDGRIEVTVVAGGLHLEELLSLMPALLRDEEPVHEGYHQFRVRHAEVTAAGGGAFPVTVDGEPTMAGHLIAEVVPGRLRVLVPEQP